MKNRSLQSVIAFMALLFLIAAFTSCKKSKNTSDNFDKKDWDIFYSKKVAGTSTSEIWSVHIDGSNDHKINVALPNGWAIPADNIALVNYARIFSLAYNEGSNQNAIFTFDITGGNLSLLVPTAGSDKIAIKGYLSTLPVAVLYTKQTGNNSQELWSIGFDGSNNRKFGLTLPANTSLTTDDQVAVLNASQSAVYLTARFTDPLSSSISYPLYKCDLFGSGASQFNIGETGHITLQDAQYVNGLLYTKINSVSSANELWLVNADGSNKHKINIALPAGVYLQNKQMAKLSWVDKSLIFLTTTNSSGNAVGGQAAIYSADISGSNLQLVKQFNASDEVALQGYYQKQRID